MGRIFAKLYFFWQIHPMGDELESTKFMDLFLFPQSDGRGIRRIPHQADTHKTTVILIL
jgi:hypothetical protein